MTVVAPVPVAVWTIVVIVMAIVVVRVVAPVICRIRVVISWSDRYSKITVSLRFLRHDSDEAKGYQK